MHGSALPRLVPILGQGRAADSPFYVLHLAFQGPLCGSRVSGEKPPGPSSGSGKEKHLLSWAGCQLLLGPA